jgi:YidC/Oxa1 family membrane protein insertase
MLLQMPVFFALYVVLYNSIDLRGAHFLGWITDLSSPDPWKILPVLMGASMFWQQKQTGMGGAGMGAGGGAQQDQQKMMKWMMPVFLTFIFFRLPAGIVLYWLSYNIFTGFQQFFIMRKKNG